MRSQVIPLILCFGVPMPLLVAQTTEPAPAGQSPAGAAASEAPAPAPASAAPSAEPTPAAEPALPVSQGDLEEPPPLSGLFPEGGEDQGLPADFTQTVTMNLLKALVEEGILKRDKAEALLQQAEKEALAARKADADRKSAAAAEVDDAMRVSYVPESVRQQIKEEVRNEVLNDLKPGGTLSLLKIPEPVSSHKFGGEMRLRYEHISFPEGNDNTGAFPIFNSINTGAPFDTAGVVFSPQYNTSEYRQRFRTQVRIGAEFDLDEGWLAGIRIATGNDNSPTSMNQTIGSAGGAQGGNFSKYALWLDRAFVKFTAENSKAAATVFAGRFDNPFQSTNMIYDDDLGFDGAAMKLKANAHDRFKPWLTVGAFPIFNTELNFATNQPVKFQSIDKYLYGGQVGTDLKIGKSTTAKFSGAFYDFRNVEGKASTPFLPLASSDAGDTDHTRPSFAQRGNTYRPIRTIIPDPLNNFGTSNQWQYFGLASEFRPASFNGRIDFNGLEPVQISLIGEYIKNTAYDKEAIEAEAVNNRGPLPVDAETGTASGIGLYEGTDVAWLVGIKIGNAVLQKKGDWQLGVDYRYVGADAVVDGFTNSDFGGGGTNLKGINFSGRVAISKKASVGLTWMSADQIAGPPMRSDTVQLDFQVKF